MKRTVVTPTDACARRGLGTCIYVHVCVCVCFFC